MSRCGFDQLEVPLKVSRVAAARHSAGVHQQCISALISAISHCECLIVLGSGAALIHTKGIYKGRKPTINAAELRRLRDEEKLGPAAIARRLGNSRASVYRVLGKSGPA